MSLGEAGIFTVGKKGDAAGAIVSGGEDSC